MNRLNVKTLGCAIGMTMIGGLVVAASDSANQVEDDVIAAQRAALATSTDGAGFGPQSPRDIDNMAGNNELVFEAAPAYTDMNLCNIHMHEGAEHKGGQFTSFAGNGNGAGYKTGFEYSGELTAAELTAVPMVVGAGDKGLLQPGDTIEVHYVHSSAQVTPGPTLGACLSESIMNPQLRVETQVYVVVNDADALDFATLTEIGEVDGKIQALNIPNNTGTAVQYAGSTTGPSYNEVGSPLQVSWSVRPEIAKVDISTVAKWFEGNVFDENHAHGVRNLVTNPELLSPISK